MIIDAYAADRAFAWLLNPWHFTLAYLLFVAGLALDLFALTVLARRTVRAARAQLLSLGALTVVVALRTSTPPAAWIRCVRPVAADYRVTLPAGQPRPISIAWTGPARREARTIAAASACLSPPPALPRVSTLSPVATRVIRPARALAVEAVAFKTAAEKLIAGDR